MGVTSNIVSTIGAVVANEAMKFLLGHKSRLEGSLMTVDLAGPDFIISKLSKRADCNECGELRKTKENERDHGDLVTILCGETSATIIPASPMTLNLEIISQRLGAEKILALSANVLVFQDDGVEVSLFKNGRLIINGVKSEEDAREKSTKVWDLLGIQEKTMRQID